MKRAHFCCFRVSGGAWQDAATGVLSHGPFLQIGRLFESITLQESRYLGRQVCLTGSAR